MEIIAHFSSFNPRRYSLPWVAEFTNGKYNFNSRCGMYTGNAKNGEAGDLVVFDPKEGQVYAWGQKDYRRNGTILSYSVFGGGKFVACDKIGRPLEEAKDNG